METTGAEAFYNAVKAKPDSSIKLAKAQAVLQTPAGQPDLQLQLPKDADVRSHAACVHMSTCERENASWVVTLALEVT
jgi:hypothetical protein